MANARKSGVYVEYRKKTLVQEMTETGSEGAGGYYGIYTGSSYHIDEVFADVGVEPQYNGSWKKRRSVAEANGITNGYTGTYEQNVRLMGLAREGKLKRVGGGGPSVRQVMKTASKTEATGFIAPYAENISYTDAAEGQGDDISITLNDREKKFIGAWHPEKGMYVYLQIITEDWIKDGDKKKFECGEFLVDDVSYDGPPATCSIDGVSVPQDQDFRSAKVTRTWEGASLHQMVNAIANKYGLQVMVDAPDVLIESIEQNGRTDCAFLYQLCKSYGYAMKVYSDRIIVYDVEAYEKKSAVKTIREKDCEKYRIRDSVYGTYTGANMAFTDPNTEAEYSITIGSEGRMYEGNVTTDSMADLEKKGIAALNMANRQACVATLRIFPAPGISAGQNVNLSGFGTYDGKYFIDKVKHSMSGGSAYIQTLTLHKVQEWIKSVSVHAVEQAKEASGETVTYTVKSGDTLWAIAKQYLGSGPRYVEIYNDNRDTIESTAKSHGKANSDNGHWIWPGETLTIHVS